ncbi:MAG: YbdK family carboxylate-amine ligase [Candidatus Marinimicrobia bacterium]|nr:YbdK family carboxylate-amine ligase [Candidatus Neomarinimicrobiota bacterium]
MKSPESVFQHDNPFTIGIEEEYMLCNPETGELINRANEIMDNIANDLKSRYSYELILSEIEINTSVCKTVSDALEEITYLRANTKKMGESLDFRLGIGGTHPTAICKDQKFVDNDSYRWVADQLSYYARRNITFANHVHVAVNDAECAIHVANSLRRWIAPLLALSTNSPFFEGEFTGLRSSRTFQFGVFPRTNIPVRFNDFKEYNNLIDKYLETETITKPRQIWWKIRPHIDFGTIEFRICDAQRSLRNIEMLAALAQALVHRSVEDYNSKTLIESFNMEYLYDSLWKATRFSMDAKIIDPVTHKVCSLKEQIGKMMKYSNDSLHFFNNSHVVKSVNHICENGTEGDDQIEVYNNSGFVGLKSYLMDNIEFQHN